jgi:cyclic pyranopterin phosphate synthase
VQASPYLATAVIVARLLVDSFGRPLTDLRVSVTERCNFRCFYCHNEGQGTSVLPMQSAHSDEMTPDEVERIVRVGAGVGVQRVKLTGGEPLVRPDLEQIVERTSAYVETSLTTNGSMLEHRALALKHAGLARVNVSVDSLRPDEFSAIRGGALAPVLRGVRAALEADLRPVKLNMVLYKETVKNLEAMLDFVRAGDGLELQLIQYMPEMAWQRAYAVDVQAVRERLAAMADASTTRDMHHRRRYRVRGAWVELVDPVNNAEFCMNCHRVRVTHDGHLKGCLNRNDDLVPTRGLDDDGVRRAFETVVRERRPYYGVHVPLVR